MGGSTATSRPRDLTPREYTNLRGPLASSLSGFLSAGGLPGYTGDLSAALTPAEGEVLALLNQRTTQPSAAYDTAMNTLVGQSGGRVNPFATAAGVTPQESAILSQIISGTAPTALQTANRDQLGRTISGAYLDPTSNPFLAATIDAAVRPIMEQFGQDTLANRSAFTRAGQTIAPPGRGSSPFEMAQALLTRGVANAVGDTSANIAYSNYAAERDRQVNAGNAAELLAGMDQNQLVTALSAAGLPREVLDTALQRRAGAFETDQTRQQSAATAIPQLEATQIEGILQNLQAQALPRMIEELGIERGMAEFQRQQQTLLQLLGLTAGVSSPTVANETRQSGVNPFLSLLGSGVGGGIGNAAGTFFGNALFGG